jgi:uncharacterized protein YoxC
MVKHVGFLDANVNGKGLSSDVDGLTRDGNKVLDETNANAEDISVDNTSFTGILASDADLQAAMSRVDTEIPSIIDNYYDSSKTSDGLIRKSALTQIAESGFNFQQKFEADLTGVNSITIPVNNISGDDLEILIYGRSDVSADQDYIGIRFNGDTGSNYDSVGRYATADNTEGGLSNDGAGLSYGVIGAIPGSTASANYGGALKLIVPSFKETSYYKAYVGDGQDYESSTSENAGVVNYKVGGFWKSTSAIASVTIYSLSSSDFTSGKLICRGYGVNSGGSFSREILRVDGYRSTDQTISNETETTVIFDSEPIDIDSAYNNTTGIWTCPKDAKYRIVAQLMFDTTSGYGIVYKNTSTAVIESGAVISVGNSFVNLDKTLDLVYGDTIHVVGWRSGGTKIYGGVSKTFLQVTEELSGSVVGDVKLTEDITVNFDNSMSDTQIQDIINSQPKNLNSYTLTFQYADGTYTLTSGHNYDDFYGGSLIIQGNSSEATTMHTNQAVHLNGSGLSAGVRNINVNNCACLCYVKWMKFTHPDLLNCMGAFIYGTLYCEVSFCYSLGVGNTTECSGLYWMFSKGSCTENYVSNVKNGIVSSCAQLRCNANSSTGTAPLYGHYVINGGIISITDVTTFLNGYYCPFAVGYDGRSGTIYNVPNHTITFDNSMTAAIMQNTINLQQRDLKSSTVSFQFSDGAYTLNGQLQFINFSNGTLNIQGNISEGSGPYTSQAVHLNAGSWGGTGGTAGVIQLLRNSVQINLKNLKITVPDVANTNGVYAANHSGYITVADNYILGSGKTNTNFGIRFFAVGPGDLSRNYLSNMDRAIHIDRSLANSNDNRGTGTACNYGLSVTTAGLLSISGGDVPSWSVSPFLRTNGGFIRLRAGVTINIPTSMTAAQVQTIVSNCPNELDGYSLTFQFANGTHTWNSNVAVRDFSGGFLYFQGDTTEGTAAYTTQAVYIDANTWAGAANGVLWFERCACFVIVRNLKIRVPNVNDCSGVYMSLGMVATVSANYILAAAKTNTNVGIRANRCNSNINNNYVSNLYRGIYADTCVVVSGSNPSTGTNPTYGLYATQGSTIGKSSTQPTGTTANELTATGGSILA